MSIFTQRAEQKVFQKFWRCAHYPSALENFRSTRQTCEWDCHTQELRWYHNGEHPMPKSWSDNAGRERTAS